MMAFDGTQFEGTDFWTLIRKIIVSLVEYTKKILLQAASQGIILEPANIDITVEPNNILIDLEEE